MNKVIKTACQRLDISSEIEISEYAGHTGTSVDSTVKVSHMPGPVAFFESVFCLENYKLLCGL